jgi:hypothetical protein
MQSFWSILPTGNSLLLFLVCLGVGAFVLFMFCLDQFDKLTVNSDDNDPWKFVVPRYLTPRRQYLTGFLFYSGTMMLIFAGISVLGPDRFTQIAKAFGINASLDDYSTFPIVIAFVLVGLHPSLRLPKTLDFEVVIRRTGHRLAYIPRNMDRIFNYMRFAEFDLSQENVNEAWSAIELDRLDLGAADLKAIGPLIDRMALLYMRAAIMAGDIQFLGAANLANNLNLEVFKQYRPEIQNVGVNLQAIHARLSQLEAENAGERRKMIAGAQHDLIKNLEFLYVIFACAVTAKGVGHDAERLRAIGFTSSPQLTDLIPWDPILKTVGAVVLVLLVATVVAARMFPGMARQNNIPTDTAAVTWLLFTILVVHLGAIGQGLGTRARLIAQEKYYSDSGSVQALAYIQIFVRCAILGFICYFTLNFGNLVAGLSGANRLPASEAVWNYLHLYAIWAIAPGTCGAMTAYLIDRPVDSIPDRLISGAAQGCAMIVVVVFAIELTTQEVPIGFYIFTVSIYSLLGFSLGVQLPYAIKRHWAAMEERLPDKILVLRTNVTQYFRDIQQFTNWLNTRNEGLDARRPLDILSEDGGLQRLVAYVAGSRTKISATGL